MERETIAYLHHIPQKDYESGCDGHEKNKDEMMNTSGDRTRNRKGAHAS